MRLRRVDFEIEVRVAHNNLRALLRAQLAHQVDVVEVLHRAAAEEPGDRAHFVDENRVEALALEVVERLKGADDGLAG